MRVCSVCELASCEWVVRQLWVVNAGGGVVNARGGGGVLVACNASKCGRIECWWWQQLLLAFPASTGSSSSKKK